MVITDGIYTFRFMCATSIVTQDTRRKERKKKETKLKHIWRIPYKHIMRSRLIIHATD